MTNQNRLHLNTIHCNAMDIITVNIGTETPGPGCSKLTTSIVNISLKFQTLISEIHQYFLLKIHGKCLHCKSFSHFFNETYQCIWL